MQLTFIFIGIIGLLVLTYSIGILIKSIGSKEIARFSLDSEVRSIDLDSNKLLALSFLGARFVKNKGKFEVQLKSENGSLVELNKTAPTYGFRKNRKFGLEYYHFKISKKGKYTLSVKNLDDLIARKAMLSSKVLPPESLKILLRETISARERFFLIIGLVFGLNALMWGIILGFTNLFG